MVWQISEHRAGGHSAGKAGEQGHTGGRLAAVTQSENKHVNGEQSKQTIQVFCFSFGAPVGVSSDVQTRLHEALNPFGPLC